MGAIDSFRSWVEARRDLWFDLLRIYLGLGLFAKGLHFISDREFLMDLLLDAGQFEMGGTALAHYVALAHLGGGFCMAIGLLTRLAALVQMPVLAGAVLLVGLPEGLFTRGQTLEFSLLVLFLLGLVFLAGPGRWSVDHFVFGRSNAPPL